MANLPSYDELPIRPGAPAGSSWGVWGDDDVFGCLNLLTPERIVDAARLVQKGAVFALNLDVAQPDPPLFNRAAPEHTVLGEGQGHDDLLNFNTQASSQWDGFRHVGSHHGFYNGVADGDHGMHHWAARGIAGRTVLVDIGRASAVDVDPSDSTPITPDDLDATLAEQGIEVEPGDILLLRTGWLTWYRTLDADARRALAGALKAPGLRPGKDVQRWLWDHHIAAIGADNPSVETWPPGAHLAPDARRELARDPDRLADVFMHRALLPLLGIPLGELWDLDALAADCAEDGRYVGLFTSAPLHVRAGVASPPNALVIK